MRRAASGPKLHVPGWQHGAVNGGSAGGAGANSGGGGSEGSESSANGGGGVGGNCANMTQEEIGRAEGGCWTEGGGLADGARR